jgi:acetyl esterase/lipase
LVTCYAKGHDLAHPYLSPLFADMSGFPPTFLQAGTRDPFLSNAVRMHRRLRAARIAAELPLEHIGQCGDVGRVVVFEAMPHGGFGGAPEDLEMRGEVRRFIDRIRSLN